MRRFVTAVAALAVAVGSLVTAPAAHALPAVAVVVVSGASTKGPAVSFPTVPGDQYVVTATGVVEPLLTVPGVLPRPHDCAWAFDGVAPPTAESLFYVDGQPAGCAGQPYSDTHTYQWAMIGTGEPFRFSTPVVIAGAVTFTVTGQRANVAHPVEGACDLLWTTTSALDYVPVTIHATATATRPRPAVSTYVVCDVTSEVGAKHLALGLPGPVVETADRMVVPPGAALQVCWYAGATWDDGAETTTPTTCYIAYVGF